MESISKVLTKNVVQILPSKEELYKLLGKKKIKLYLGIDPSNPTIHLGNAIALEKLRQFQELGHKVILLIGDFTGTIGDPTDKTATRKRLTKKQVLENAKTYKKQASKILNFNGSNPAEIKFNSQWLSKLTFADLVELASHLTIQQLEERDMFIKRKKEGKPIYLHEFLYPVMQGYDSVEMNVDLEIGGTDQTFNMLIGRQLAKSLKNKEKFILTIPLLLGTDGQKMGKTRGNFIPLGASANEMFGKIMSISDNLIKHYFELTTDIDLRSVNFTKPMNAKKKLATEVVKIYHGEKKATEAKREFERVFQKKQAPKEIQQIPIKGTVSLIDFMVENNLASGPTAAKALIRQNAVEINGRVISYGKIKLLGEEIIKIGKKTFIKTARK